MTIKLSSSQVKQLKDIAKNIGSALRLCVRCNTHTSHHKYEHEYHDENENKNKDIYHICTKCDQHN